MSVYRRTPYKRIRRSYARVPRVIRPLAANDCRFVCEKIVEIKEDGNGDSWVTMWNGTVAASGANNVTFYDQQEYQNMAQNFRYYRITGMSMEVSLTVSFADGRICSGAVMAAGPAITFPQMVPAPEQLAGLEYSKLASPGQTTKLYYDCGRENMQALQSSVPVTDISTQANSQVISTGLFTQNVGNGSNTGMALCRWYITFSGRRG